MDTPDFEQPVSAEYVAQFLGLTPRTVLQMARKAKKPLPHYRVGRYYRFYMSDVVQYFNLPKRSGDNADGASQ